MTQTHSLQLDRIVFIGRTYFEYLRMFGLDEPGLRGVRILDCADDYPQGIGEGRYVRAELPRLPFPDKSFSF